jgi:HEAT repeat protein
VYFEEIIKAYPEEAGKLLSLCVEEMTVHLRLVYLVALVVEDPQKASREVLALLPTLEKEAMGTAFAVLAAYPTEKGLGTLASYLDQDDWKLKMKAASALSEARATQYIPDILNAAEACDGPVRSGLKEIAGRMGEE